MAQGIGKNVSVPSRGFCFRTFTTKGRKISGTAAVSVPSRGFCFRTAADLVEMDGKEVAFPSPHGDFVFERETGRRLVRLRALVSVPSRGFCFRTRYFLVKVVPFLNLVSVPSRGFCFRTCNLQVPYSHRNRIRFRPLTGILFSNCDNKNDEHLILEI